MGKAHDHDLAAMAPHAEPEWVDAFVVEQRVLGVPGTRIGDALAVIEGHLCETGESAAEAFGPATEYARELASSEGSGSSGLGASTMVSGALGLAGIVLLPRAVTGWLEAAPVTVTTGDFVVAGLLAALTALVLVFPERAIRLILDRPVLAFLLGPLLVGVFVAAFVLWRTPVVDLPALAVGLVAGAGLLVAAVLSWREPADLVADPSGRTYGSARATRLTTALALPIIALLMCLVSWVTWLLT
ncbi:hypothetical protein KILIM_066_00360 [Kineosphaera limosa NBRC 100340]|uniref:Uncharacterized protein n=2 Tax=Kineosphaera TaxID=211469 RepID=K6WDN9_9MICO|nr:hypothetical protein KILIM_066_00360 [Kineosphaera limosa NBRC 100340]